jgi:hypothetical protein
MTSAFISHSSTDKLFAVKLCEDLIKLGGSVWLDEKDLNIGDTILDGIAKGIEDCDFTIAILSKSSIKSRWVQKELSLAMKKEIETGKKVVLPIRIDVCEPPLAISDKLYFDVFDDDAYSKLLPRLIRALGLEKSPSTIPFFSAEETKIIKQFEEIFEDDRLFEYRAECQDAANLIVEVSTKYPGKYNGYIEELYRSSQGIPTYKAGLVYSAARKALGL